VGAALESRYQKWSWGFNLHHTKTHARRFSQVVFSVDNSSMLHAGHTVMQESIVIDDINNIWETHQLNKSKYLWNVQMCPFVLHSLTHGVFFCLPVHYSVKHGSMIMLIDSFIVHYSVKHGITILSIFFNYSVKHGVTFFCPCTLFCEAWNYDYVDWFIFCTLFCDTWDNGFLIKSLNLAGLLEY
jgi:hypothetical protein